MRPPTSYEPASITPMPFVEAPAPLADTNLQPGRFEPPTPTAPETQGIGIGTRTVTDDPGTTLQRYESTAPSPPSPAHSRAATTLLAIAEREEAQGKFGLAAQQVERAIDLEPRNADLWHHLAKLRLTEGRLEAAVEAAQTSNRLAGGNLELRRNNWGLISEVRFEQGDTTAAEQARRMVEELY
jgi:tetratricopeptide (TPR) repeat protein